MTQKRITIDKNVAVYSGRGRKLLYPFDKLKVGESFAIRDYSPEKFNAVKTAAYGYGARHNMQFKASSRKVGNARIIRIWREK